MSGRPPSREHTGERSARPVAGAVQRMRPVRLSRRQRAYLQLRRRVDVLLALGGLAVAAIPMALVAVGVLITMGRPVLFAQERMSEGGRVFRLWKFRSMRHPGDRPLIQDEDRLVPFGRFIRSTSLDELPSLWNIVRGDMALIGPRPLPTYYLGRFSAEQFARHTVPSGLTGHAQVHGRNEVQWDTRMLMDQDYIQRLGPRRDLTILVDTVAVVLGRKGVHYEGGLTSSTDFPGPQSTRDLELDGPDAEGAWVCRDRDGQVHLAGGVEILVGGIALLTSVMWGGGLLLEEAILLLVSRLRARDRISWVCVARGVELPEVLADALRGHGFVPPGADVDFPTSAVPPDVVRGEAPALVAFVERPQHGFPAPAPVLWLESSEAGRSVAGVDPPGVGVA